MFWLTFIKAGYFIRMLDILKMVLYNGLSKLDNQDGQSNPRVVSYSLHKITNVYTIRHKCISSNDT